MTVPVTGNLGSTWKSGRRCLPEIHATRLSVSGSLRPKLGLLILFVVLVISLVLVGVPLVTKYLILSSNPTSNTPLYLTLLKQFPSGEAQVLSPPQLHESLGTLASWLGEGEVRESLCSSLNCSVRGDISSVRRHVLHNITFFLPSQGSYSEAGQEWLKKARVHKLDWRVNKAREEVRTWLEKHGGGPEGQALLQDLDINHVSVLGSAELVAHVSEGCETSDKEKVLIVSGEIPMIKTETGLAVRIPLQSDLILELRSGLPIQETLVESDFKKGKLSVTFPVLSLTTEKRLEKVLTDGSLRKTFGLDSDLTPLVERLGGVRVAQHYHKASLNVQCGSVKNDGIHQKRRESVVLKKPFSFIVKDLASPLPLFIGTVV